ncbi:SIR2 family protein [Listeria monocytogenes]|nr:SIR2 family protein [Listeria monocytogenes]ECV6728805.1 SIR2 family protein [Listeria monocytogenes]EGC3017852.1 SIR2 family protein [Listeria monocytogenes]EGF3120564.1 SIR2 family protein [Listeria monocytogenes]EGF3129352.1 SIR2 family protein [Listeria monocytogenes]
MKTYERIFKMSELIKREEVYQKIFKAFNYGNLGMFIGAGFSKAVIGDGKNPALGWLEIIRKVSKIFNIEFPQETDLLGISLPDLATDICKKIAETKGWEYSKAKTLFKEEICNISNWLPDKESEEKYREKFEYLNPAWIVTTNYDQVIEMILTGKCISLNPMSYLSAPSNVIPVYHLHGTRLEAESIVITQEDYIPMFRPNEYRQVKLAMTIRESTTLILGYGLGDVNVLSAVDWSKNIYTEETTYPHEIIQALWKSNPKKDAYIDENGNIILEIEDLETFLDELIEFIKLEEIKYKEKLKELNRLIDDLKVTNDDFIDSFVNDKDARLEILKVVSEFEYQTVLPYIEFLNNCLDKLWNESSVNGAFEKYNEYLTIILDILINYEYKKMPQKLFKLSMEGLDWVLGYIDLNPAERTLGNSYPASDQWHDRKNSIPDGTKEQIYQYAEKNKLHQLTIATEEFSENLYSVEK